MSGITRRVRDIRLAKSVVEGEDIVSATDCALRWMLTRLAKRLLLERGRFTLKEPFPAQEDGWSPATTTWATTRL